MGLKIIPEQKITSCDGCGSVEHENPSKWRIGGEISLACDGLDYQGYAVGPGDRIHFIFCDSCYVEMKRLIDNGMRGLGVIV